MSNTPTSAFRMVVVKVCPKCGARYDPSAQFCPADGMSLRTDQDNDPMIGQTVAGFRVRKKLGSGGMGRVYLAVQESTQRLCALKVLDPEVATNDEARRRFEREATNHAQLKSHPHIAELYDFGVTTKGIVYLAMEYVAGESLAELLKRATHLTPPRAVSIASQVGDGLAAAHALGVVHRDLKPDNIMVTPRSDGTDHVKLVDFGVAKRPRDQRQKVTSTGFAVGTPQYMSPEQIAADAVDHRSDTYSLGLVTFVMLTGTLPYPADGRMDSVTARMIGRLRTLSEVRPEVAWPSALQETLNRATAPAPEGRYASVRDFGRDLVLATASWRPGSIPLATTQSVAAPSGLMREIRL